jgi:16S rRNA (adenine1518-N6/adenine1519-N6)-dimethyltransferase
MVDEADIAETDTVLEIGAGVGNITRKLAQVAETVIVYENDDQMIPALNEHIKDMDNVKINQQDFKKARVPPFTKCVSNIPFHLSSDIMEFLGERQNLSVLLVQEAFARRLIARPGSEGYTRTSVEAQYNFTPVYADTIYDINFTPSPDTNVAMIKLYPSRDKFDADDEEFFFHTIQALFTHKNKKLRNAFFDSRHMFDLAKEEAKKLQDELPYSEERVFTLNVAEFVEVADRLDELMDLIIN